MRPIAIFIGLALSGCAGSFTPHNQVRLEIGGPPIDASQTSQPFLYAIPRGTGGPGDGGLLAQSWSMLGREDLGAASMSNEYAAVECEPVEGGPSGWDAVVDAIAARAEGHRVVIINESHAVTRHRQTARRLLSRLRAKGFTHLAVETLTNVSEGAAPVDEHAGQAWPHQDDGFYSREPVFGRLIRDAKALGYRLVPYEQVLDPAAPAVGGPRERIASREAAQASHLAAVLRTMSPDERLLVYVGYSHAKEIAEIDNAGQATEWMAARLKALTGIDPLTVAQTVCRHDGVDAFLAMPPAGLQAGLFDMIVSYPVETFVDNRPQWRRQEGDIAIAIPASLRPTDTPVVVEAFKWGEPIDAVPVDRVYVAPRENIPLLLPPGRYHLRAVRMTRN